MAIRVFKFTGKNTDGDYYTRNTCFWKRLQKKRVHPVLNIRYNKLHRSDLCSDLVFHFYVHPLQAAIFHNTHVPGYDQFWSAKAEGKMVFSNNKAGSTQLTLLNKVKLPNIKHITLKKVIKAINTCQNDIVLNYKPHSEILSSDLAYIKNLILRHVSHDYTDQMKFWKTLAKLIFGRL